ncbi:hypothetical protein CGC21_10545 [Leishmania donovani]|uniref:Nucleoplasmin-like domain-containing protein n=1 Tax=Leishmania donovani TaxID=5661 RepID=A0A504XZE8_LEIDO|nr:hypothetical protein CGC21_10545 [Leishmania donovani]
MMQEFHAFSVSPNKEHKLEIPAGCGFHLSVVSLPRGTNGKSTVYVSADGKSYALASLDSQQNVLQAPTDLIFNYQQQVIFFAKGSATVHCVGYRQELDFSDDDDAPFAMESGSDDDTRDAKKAAVKLPADAITDAETAKRKPAAAAAATESVSEDEEDEDEDEELADSAEEASADAAGGSLQSRPSAGGSPQGLKKNGSGSSQGRPNGHSPQGRPSAGGSPQGLKKNGSGSSQGRPNGHSPQGRRGF